jgi:hypothetical protein
MIKRDCSCQRTLLEEPSMFVFRNTRCGALLAVFASVLFLVGCDAFSGLVSQGDSGNQTETVDSGEATTQSTGPVRQSQPNGMGMPPSGEGEMAEMMAGDGGMSIPGGPPDEMDTAGDFAAQFGTAIPDDGAPGPGAGTDEYFSSGAGVADPAQGTGAPGDFEDGTTGYLDTVNGGAGALFNPDDYDVYGNYIGSGAVKKAGTPAAGGARPRGPAAGKDDAPSGRESVLRNKNPRARPVPKPSARPNGSSGGTTVPPPKTEPPAVLSGQPLFRLSNPVSHFDGTGFSLGFSVDYQLLRAPENGTTYYWVISFEEQDKSGRGSQMRKIQEAFRPTDSSTLKVVIPLKGKPKEPYRCVIRAKKDGKLSQVSPTATFPTTFK